MARPRRLLKHESERGGEDDDDGNGTCSGCACKNQGAGHVDHCHASRPTVYLVLQRLPAACGSHISSREIGPSRNLRSGRCRALPVCRVGFGSVAAPSIAATAAVIVAATAVVAHRIFVDVTRVNVVADAGVFQLLS